GLDGLVLILGAEIGDRDLQRLGDGRERLQVRRPLAALDHRQERHADTGALAQVLLSHPGGARYPELADPAPDFLDNSRLYKSLRTPVARSCGRFVPAPDKVARHRQ